MASELEVGKVKAADAELNATDYHLKLQDGAGNPWYLRAPDGSLRMHLNGTGDVMTFDSSGNVGINTSSVEAGWSTSCAPIFEISGTKPTLILEEPSVGEFSFVTKNGNLYISDEENNAARLTIDSTGLATFSGGITVSGGSTNIGSGFPELTISSGAITVTDSTHRVDTESDSASDDLDTINGGTQGSILVLRSVDSSRDVTVKDATGNIYLAGDFALNHAQRFITLIKYGGGWYELSRSANA